MNLKPQPNVLKQWPRLKAGAHATTYTSFASSTFYEDVAGGVLLGGSVSYGVASQALPFPEASCRSGDGDALSYGPWLACIPSQINPRQAFR